MSIFELAAGADQLPFSSLLNLHLNHFGRSLQVMGQNSQPHPAFRASKTPIPAAA